MVERGGLPRMCFLSGWQHRRGAGTRQCVSVSTLVGARGCDAAGGGWCAISSERRDDSDGNLPSCQAVRASASALPARSLPSLAPSQSTAWLSLPPVRPLFGSLLPGASIER